MDEIAELQYSGGLALSARSSAPASSEQLLHHRLMRILVPPRRIGPRLVHHRHLDVALLDPHTTNLPRRLPKPFFLAAGPAPTSHAAAPAAFDALLVTLSTIRSIPGSTPTTIRHPRAQCHPTPHHPSRSLQRTRRRARGVMRTQSTAAGLAQRDRFGTPLLIHIPECAICTPVHALAPRARYSAPLDDPLTFCPHGEAAGRKECSTRERVGETIPAVSGARYFASPRSYPHRSRAQNEDDEKARRALKAVRLLFLILPDSRAPASSTPPCHCCSYAPAAAPLDDHEESPEDDAAAGWVTFLLRGAVSENGRDCTSADAVLIVPGSFDVITRTSRESSGATLVVGREKRGQDWLIGDEGSAAGARCNGVGAAACSKTARSQNSPSLRLLGIGGLRLVVPTLAVTLCPLLSQVVMFRARLQALGPPSRALRSPSRAEPDVGLGRAQGSGLKIFRPNAGPEARARTPKSSTYESAKRNFWAAWFINVDTESLSHPMPGPSPSPGLKALHAGSGSGLRNLRPRPPQARPKPGFPGRAGP
ncbi:hypothetical protein DFH09DRAFT_1106465 [Mycena vulgaris]|nr:hypothetical protein DFH09DRAFT_1106465 [Mycena vulgaris]